MYKHLLFVFIVLSSCTSHKSDSAKFKDNSPGYDVAAFYFPNYHMTDKRNNERYGTGYSEWDLVRTAKPRFDGHQQPKVPLWGFADESSPEIMELKIETAAKYGVDVFIYDWYYYNDGLFIEKGLEEGFMKARNNNKMKFSLMWANHDWIDLFPRIFSDGRANELFYSGAITKKTWDKMTDYIVEKYFLHPSYHLIDGCPFFSIYELFRLVDGLGGTENTRVALEEFRQKTKAAGFKDMHLNAIVWGVQILPGEKQITNTDELLQTLGFNSTTSYVWIHHVMLDEFPTYDYSKLGEKYFDYANKTTSEFSVPYYVNVTMGWDPSPRCEPSDTFINYGYPCMSVVVNNTPEAFGNYLEKAKSWTDKNVSGTKIITINNWNEWTEGSYLEPDRKNGYGYLEKVLEVFGKEE